MNKNVIVGTIRFWLANLANKVCGVATLYYTNAAEWNEYLGIEECPDCGDAVEIAGLCDACLEARTWPG